MICANFCLYRRLLRFLCSAFSLMRNELVYLGRQNYEHFSGRHAPPKLRLLFEMLKRQRHADKRQLRRHGVGGLCGRFHNAREHLGFVTRPRVFPISDLDQTSSIAALKPSPPNRDMTCAASPIRVRAGRFRRAQPATHESSGPQFDRCWRE